MFEEIYEIFKLELDGEEFDTDDDALVAANKAMRSVLTEREWKFLQTSTTFAPDDLTFGSRDNFEKVIRVWYDGAELNKAELDERFDTRFDYYIDHVTKEIMLITDFYSGKDLVVDYVSRPDDIELENEPISVNLLNVLIAYTMGLTYFRKDQDTTIYTILEEKRADALNELIDFNNTL